MPYRTKSYKNIKINTSTSNFMEEEVVFSMFQGIRTSYFWKYFSKAKKTRFQLL